MGARRIGCPEAERAWARVGIVSGGAAKEAEQAAALGLDAYVTGGPESPPPFSPGRRVSTSLPSAITPPSAWASRPSASTSRPRSRLDTLFIEVENEA